MTPGLFGRRNISEGRKAAYATFILLQFLLLICFFFLAAGCVTVSEERTAPKIDPVIQEEKLLNSQLSLVQLKLDQHHPEQAHQMLRPLLERFPRRVPVLNMAGLIQLSLGNSRLSRKYFVRALKISPSPVLVLNLSSSLLSARLYSKAEKVLKKNHNRFKKYRYMERYWHNLSLALAHQNKWNQALVGFRKALDANPAFILTLNQLGDLYSRAKKYNKALRFYKKSMDYCKTCLYPVERVAALYLHHRQPQKAYQVMERFRNHQGTQVKVGRRFKKLFKVARSKIRRSRRKSQKQT